MWEGTDIQYPTSTEQVQSSEYLTVRACEKAAPHEIHKINV